MVSDASADAVGINSFLNGVEHVVDFQRPRAARACCQRGKVGRVQATHPQRTQASFGQNHRVSVVSEFFRRLNGGCRSSPHSVFQTSCFI